MTDTSEDAPESAGTDQPVSGEPDTVSDPGLDGGEGGDWSGEGGATSQGPATDPEDAGRSIQGPRDNDNT